MRSKYTNQELYQWQVGQISGVYFQSYQLAYDLAKRAERCFRFELGLQDSSYISFGYWDSLKKGLLAGEKLQYDLRRLETALPGAEPPRVRADQARLAGAARPAGAGASCGRPAAASSDLPEEIFDLDYPGHYFRRIKSVSLTLPCVAGPYTTISCTLRLLKNSIRINTANGDNGYPRNTDDDGLPADDTRFVENNIPVKAIAASSAPERQRRVRAELPRRALPARSRAPARSASGRWSCSATCRPTTRSGDPDFGKPLRQFDYGTIADAVLHIKYTAREDAGPFKNGAFAHLRDYFSRTARRRRCAAQPAAGVPEPVAPFPAPDQPGRRQRLRAGDVAGSLPAAGRGKDPEDQHDLAAGALQRRLRRYDSSVKFARIDATAHGARPEIRKQSVRSICRAVPHD